MKKNIKKHQVTFNMNDPDQKAMYDYVNKYPNVSAKYKRMILLEMQGTPLQMPPKEEEVADTEDKPLSNIALDLIL